MKAKNNRLRLQQPLGSLGTGDKLKVLLHSQVLVHVGLILTLLTLVAGLPPNSQVSGS